MSTERRPHPNLVLSSAGAVTTIRIDREEALGALSRSLLESLQTVLAQLARSDARVVVLTGTGRGFVAGADIEEYSGVTQEQFVDYQRLGRAVFDAVADLPQCTLAAVNGFALGGGFEIALACDLMIAAERAKFGLPEVSLGLLPGGGGTQRLSRALGARFTKELVVTGRFVTAAELHRRGLLAAVHPGEELAAAAADLAASIAGNAPLAVRAATRLVDDGLALPLPDALSLEQDTLAELFAGHDAKEGIAAFIEKRPPVFDGH